MSLSPEAISALFQNAVALHQRGQVDEAEGLYRQVLAQDSSHYDAHRLLGILLRQKGDLQSACEWILKARDLRPNSARVNYELGVIYLDLKKFDEARTFTNQAIQFQPHFPEAYLNLGNICHATWLLDEARSHYEQSLAQNPGLAEASTNLDKIRRRGDEISTMVDCCRKWLAGLRSSELPAGARLDRRDWIPTLLNRLGLTGSGAEIGVQEGRFSEQLLRSWQGTLLYSIDPWREFEQARYIDSANVAQAEHDARYIGTIRRLMPFQNRSKIWRLTSKEAAELIDNESLDFCYIDADHGYEGVREDINLWYPKVKRGGILAGHDYINDGTYSFGSFGVKQAVKEFIESRPHPLFITGESEYEFPSWVAIKI